MTRLAALAVLTLLAAGCGAPAQPSNPTSNPTSSPTPTPSGPANMPTLALPANISGIPGPNDISVDLAPQTPAGGVPVGVDQVFELGHCGLISPIDIDGSMWDPLAGDDGNGGPLTEDQLGDLINATPVVLVLVDHDTMLMATQHGARILLTRHDGPRAYLLCD